MPRARDSVSPGSQPPGPVVKEVQDLVVLLNSYNLDQGVSNSLRAKLQTVLESLNNGITSAACGQLKAFLNEVQSQAGKKIPADKAAQLMTSADNISAMLGCN